MLWLPQPWSPLTAKIVCAAPHEALARFKTVVDGSRNWMRMRKAFGDPFNIVLHLLIPREGTRGAAHTICTVNGDQGCGSHNVATSWDWLGSNIYLHLSDVPVQWRLFLHLPNMVQNDTFFHSLIMGNRRYSKQDCNPDVFLPRDLR